MPEFDKEHSEQILDKVHLAMSKKDPNWQEKILSGNEGQLQQFHKLQRLSLEQVLKSSGTELNWKEWKELGNEFKALKADDLSDYALQKSDWLKDKVDRLEKDKNKIDEDIKEEKEKNKSNLVDLFKAKKRNIGEVWTQPSGRKVKKIREGLIVEVNEHGEPKKQSKPENKNKSKKEPKEKPKKGIGKKFKEGSDAVKALDKGIDETKGGGFANVSEEVPNKIKDAVSDNKGKKEKAQEQNIGENPRELSFSDITTKEQYTAKKDYDKEQIRQLKESIKENGFDPTFPIMVDKQDGKWTVVAGHHRFEAVKSLIEDNELPENFKIPVVTKKFASDNDRLAAQVLENQRRSVLPTDEAKAYGKMVENGWDAEKISKKLGKKLGEVNKRLALNNLSKDLFALVSKKDRSLPLGVAESIGMFAVNDNGQPNETMQIKAFKWFQENKNKINTSGPVAIQSYIKELKSEGFNGFELEKTMSETQKEALRKIGSAEKAQRNTKMIENMLKNLQNSYQRILGDSIGQINNQTVEELGASVAAQGNIETDKTLGTLDAIIQDLNRVKEALALSVKKIQSDATIPLMFGKIRKLLLRGKK